MTFAGELLTRGSFREIRKALDDRKISALQLCEESLRRLQMGQAQINGFITLLENEARVQARLADEKIQTGETHPLLGIPIAIKDNILIKGTPTTAGSKMLENFIAPFDSHVAQRLRQQGAVFVCKTNMDEFAMGSSNENSFFGSVKNPWNLKCVPGGSSGGSAAVLAARMVPLALGSDTGGSIRQPAAFCGIPGLKPTYGRVSRWGLISYASSLDQIGPMATDIEGLSALLDAISDFDPKDSTSSISSSKQNLFEEFRKNENETSLEGLRIGIPIEFFNQSGLDPQVSAMVRHEIEFLESRGAERVEISLPSLKYSVAVYYLIATAEASSNLSRYDGIHLGVRDGQLEKLEDIYSQSRSQGFGPEVKLRILLGTFALSKGSYENYFKKAAQVRRIISDDFSQAFEKCDLILGPTSPFEAFELGGRGQSNPIEMYLADVFTLGPNLAGLPAMSVNIGYSDINLPLGMQIIGPKFSEKKMIFLSQVLEKLKPQHSRVSPFCKIWEGS